MGKRVKKVFIAGICLILCMGFSAAVRAEYLYKPADQAQVEAMQWLRSVCGQKVGYTDGSEGLIEAYYEFLGAEANSYDSVRDYLTNKLPDGWVRQKGAVPQPGDILLYCPEKYDHIFKDKIAVCGEENMHYIQMQNESGMTCSVVAVAERYDSDNLMYPPYWGLIRPNFSRARALEAEGIENFEIGDTAIVSLGIYRDIILPKGVAYDISTNTLTLNGCSIDEIRYDGEKDLFINVYGSNIINSTSNGAAILLGDRSVDDLNGNLQISGSGSIELGSRASVILECRESSSKASTISIEGVTLSSKGEGIVVENTNLFIKNAHIIVDNQKTIPGGNRGYGISTVYRGGTYFSRPYGALEISDSVIELKNCFAAALACKTYSYNGVNFYGGDGKAEYKIDPEKMLMGGGNSLNASDYYETRFGNDYLLLTTQNLGLPTGYRIVNGNDAAEGGTLELPSDMAAAGKIVELTVKPGAGYVLDQILVDGEPISGSSFIMPEKDVKVKAIFKKKEVKVSSVKLTGSFTKVAKGKKITLTANVSPADATNKTLTWSTSNKKYATVNSKGVVTTKAAGAGKTVTITAKAADGSGKKGTYKIRIMKGMVKKVTIKGKTSVKAGKTLKLKASVKATDGANKTLTWSTSNKKYATVNKNGVVKALKAGKGKTVKITAKATDGSGKKATIKIKIK